MIKIVSTGGDAISTKVYQDGVELKGISAITIRPLVPGGLVEAELTFCQAELHMDAIDATVKTYARPRGLVQRLSDAWVALTRADWPE